MMNEKMNRWNSKTRLNNAIHCLSFSRYQRSPHTIRESAVKKVIQPIAWKRWAQAIYSATMMCICNILKVQVSKKISGCRCSSLENPSVSGGIDMGGYALLWNSRACFLNS